MLGHTNVIEHGVSFDPNIIPTNYHFDHPPSVSCLLVELYSA